MTFQLPCHLSRFNGPPFCLRGNHYLALCEIFFFVVLLHVSELLKMILLNFQCFSIVYELNHPVWFLIPAFSHYALTA